MYVITFYSFKGGVGRSMALVNVGVELARLGKKVLLVDFDLEAPSLTTFNIDVTTSCTKGIVDYINEYLTTDKAPHVSDFVSASHDFPSGGKIWIMPAGAPSDDYQARLAKINWLDLYEHRSGYLLIEEMKAQWQAQFAPDYVLVDSRTGHSDVSGICTRQLPDAVCFVFVPNRQNLHGLSRVVQQVRAANSAGGRAISQFFVESNVPYYDDERRTLKKNQKLFLDNLNIKSFNATLHQHPHLSVLNQSVFVDEFPETSLAEEYQRLAEILRSENLADRDTVLQQLQRMVRDLRVSRGMAVTSHDIDTLRKVSELHGTDEEICFWLGRISRTRGDFEDALIAFTQAINQGYRRPEAYLERASLVLQEKTEERVKDALKDLNTALALLSDNPKYSDVLFAVRNLLLLAPGSPEKLAALPAVQALSDDEQLNFAYAMLTSDEASMLAYGVLTRLKARLNTLSSKDRSRWRNEMSLVCIQAKKYSEAIEVLEGDQSPSGYEQSDLFNIGIARWAVKSAPPEAEFGKVIEIHEASAEVKKDPNYLQCMTIAYYVNGNRDRAVELVEQAKRMAEQTPIQHFSAWRYLKVNPKEFVADCSELRKQIDKRRDLSFPAIEKLHTKSITH